VDQTKFQRVALVAALLFVAHPLQTQAVTYLAQRVTLLAACCALLTLLFYLKARLAASSRGTAGYLCLSLLFYAAALLSKENSAAVPLLILLVELTCFRGQARPFLALIYLLPLALFVAIIFVAPAAGSGLWQAMTAFTAEPGAVPRLQYLYSQFPVIVDYLRLFVLPVGQSIDHDPIMHSSVFAPAVLLSLTLLLALASAGLFLQRSRKPLPALAGCGILWFFLTIWVESGAVPLKDLMAEQRVYLPSMGLCWAVAAVAAYFSGKRQFLLLAALIVALLSLLTLARNRVWQSEIALWQDVTIKSPDKGRGYGALGHAYQRSGANEAAVAAYQKAIALSPTDHIARNNLGALYLQEKRYKEAVQEFSRALQLMPANATIHFNLGLAYSGMGLYREAEAAFAETVRLKPDYGQAADNLAKVRGLKEQSR
jgi:tetratricopeptide (TPR) repeat protein